MAGKDIPNLRDQDFKSCYWCEHGDVTVSTLFCEKYDDYIDSELQTPACDDWQKPKEE
jgi:hypothetical protein